LGLLGVNGAGKTTLIRALAGLIWPDAGTLRVLGAAPWDLPEAARKQIACVGQDMQLPGWMTAEAAFKLHARVFPQWNGRLAAELLDEFKLPSGTRFSRLSHGQRQKLAVLLGIGQNARLLILDEPMSALDVPARRAVLSRLLEVVADGERTILLSSHLLTDLERIVDQVALINRGRLVVQASLDELKAAARKLRIPAAVPREMVEEFFPVLSN
jgi:ABC-2 type transport system ATP-binding protein